MVMRFVWKYEYDAVFINGKFFSDTFEPIEYRSRHRPLSHDPQGSALIRFFRAVGIAGWSSSTGDAFTDVACHSIYSGVMYTDMVTMPVCGPQVDLRPFFILFFVVNM